jgi:enoyl-CoA hydratase/carnithine racemase
VLGETISAAEAMSLDLANKVLPKHDGVSQTLQSLFHRKAAR